MATLSFKEFKATLPTVFKSTGIGAFVGALPGLGPSVGAFMAYGLAKIGVYQGLEMSLEDVLNLEARNQALAGRSQDRQEGVAAFREKRGNERREY